jgi:hypothetical protein
MAVLLRLLCDEWQIAGVNGMHQFIEYCGMYLIKFTLVYIEESILFLKGF